MACARGLAGQVLQQGVPGGAISRPVSCRGVRDSRTELNGKDWEAGQHRWERVRCPRAPWGCAGSPSAPHRFALVLPGRVPVGGFSVAWIPRTGRSSLMWGGNGPRHPHVPPLAKRPPVRVTELNTLYPQPPSEDSLEAATRLTLTLLSQPQAA